MAGALELRWLSNRSSGRVRAGNRVRGEDSPAGGRVLRPDVGVLRGSAARLQSARSQRQDLTVSGLKTQRLLTIGAILAAILDLAQVRTFLRHPAGPPQGCGALPFASPFGLLPIRNWF
jgi:hypothetical protein